MAFKKCDVIVMKLLHYFMVNEDYNQVIVHGANNELWLEAIGRKYRIIRLVSSYIHNDEQLKLDNYKAKTVSNRIKKKTLSMSMSVLNIYTNLGDNVTLEYDENMTNISVGKDSDLKQYKFLLELYPELFDKYMFGEKGNDLFMKITSDINEKNNINMKQAKDVFEKKRPVVTIALMTICIIMFICRFFVGANLLNSTFACIPFYIVNDNELYRIITSLFLHADILHLMFNMYALYVVGPQIEDFFGKWKYFFIYMAAGIMGNLLSLVIINSPTIGASGAIFGLLGAMIYFGYYHRVYLGDVIKSQILPLILINLIIGFSSTGIDNAAHIGGLIGGVVAAMAVGVKYKTTKVDKINGVIILSILITFLSYLIFM